MVPQRCLKMQKISHEFKNVIEKPIETWRVELTAEGRILAEAKIQRVIFQGDALTPLPFIIAILQLYSEYAPPDRNFVNRKKSSIT